LRRSEAERAAAALGCAAPSFLGYADGELVNDGRLRRDLVRAIRSVRPELLAGARPTTLWTRSGMLARLGHSDHRAAGEAVLDALYPRSLLKSFYPELEAQGLEPWIARELWLFEAPKSFSRGQRDARDETRGAPMPYEPESDDARGRRRSPGRSAARTRGFCGGGVSQAQAVLKHLCSDGGPDYGGEATGPEEGLRNSAQ
jgi:hypothetical protein